jgi:hypothetical protein
LELCSRCKIKKGGLGKAKASFNTHKITRVVEFDVIEVIGAAFAVVEGVVTSWIFDLELSPH